MQQVYNAMDNEKKENKRLKYGSSMSKKWWKHRVLHDESDQLNNGVNATVKLFCN